MFDFNKLDDYRSAIDDGVFSTGDYTLMKLIDTYIFGETDGESILVADPSWETFKKKVANYFLGGIG